MKGQAIRIADVALLAPAMVAAGFALRRRPTLSTLMIAGGVLTAAYNARNYLRKVEKDRTPRGKV